MIKTEKKIQRTSRFLKFLFIGFAALLPILDAGFFITNGYPFLPPWMKWELLPEICGFPTPSLENLTSVIKFLSFLVTLIPTVVEVTALLLLALLFHYFENLEFFTAKTVRVIKRVGYCLIASLPLYELYFALISLTLTISNPPGERIISLAVGTHQIYLVVIGIVILLISWIMDEGRKLQEEQEGTV